MKNFKYMRGFTFIEILIAMAVIGVLGSVLIVIINPATQFNKANDGKRKADLAAIQSALEQWRFDNSSYPPAVAGSLGPCGQSLVNGGITYLQRIPCDPDNTTVPSYSYSVSAAGNYCVRACLRNGSDKQADIVTYGTNNPSGLSCGTLATCDAAAGYYSYTVMNQ